MSARPEAGLYLVAKPAGETSFGVVRGFQERLAAVPGRTLKVCHGGVLDPFATGLLVVLVGQATRLFELLHEAPKTYRARVEFGRETDTGDGAGRTVREAGPVSAEALDAALTPHLGWTEQVPPATSNKRVDGERAYVRAHRGEAVVLPPSRVFLSSASWEDRSEREATLVLSCRGGFYVRSLVRDVARDAGTAAHVVALERTALGPWTVPPPGEERRVVGDGLLPWLPARTLDDAEWGAVKREQGVPRGEVLAPAWPLPEGFPAPSALVRGFHQRRLVALLAPEGDGLVPRLVLPGGL